MGVEGTWELGDALFSIDLNILSAIIICNFYCIFVFAQILIHARFYALGVAFGVLSLKLLALISSRIGNTLLNRETLHKLGYI